MAKKEKHEIAAVIDIGSSELRLHISENKQGRIKTLEQVNYPLSLGRDTFSEEKISFDHLEKTCASIKNFLGVMEGYGAARYRAVTTTAIRESKNRDYILDQIKIKTGVTLDVLDDAEEKLYIYKTMASLLNSELLESALMVYTGAGSIGVSAWLNGAVPYAQTVRTGSLRLSELFGDIQEYTGLFYTVVEEYITSLTSFFELPGRMKRLIASGKEVSMLAELTNAKKNNALYTIEKKKLDGLFEDIKTKTDDRIAEDYSLPLVKAEMLLPAILIYRNLLKLTETDSIIATEILLSDALLSEMFYPERFLNISRGFDKSTLVSAYAMADKYLVQKQHSQSVERHSLLIFDRMKKIHGMGKRDKLLLQTAAILHDTGKFINLNNHYLHTYNIVKGASIIGLNSAEMEIIALICLYHSRPTPETEPAPYIALQEKDRVLVSKLTAILRLAEAMDCAHTQKLRDIEGALSDDELVITVTTNENIALEIWAFESKAAMFEDVFGLKAVIRQRKDV